MSDIDKHYLDCVAQPIQVMQRLLSAEQFRGFLLGNYIKYKMRAGYKGEIKSDLYKARQYAYWYFLAKNGTIIDPLEHQLDNDTDVPEIF